MIYYYICGILRPEIEYMRYYKSADFFIDQEFPLSVSKTRQRDFMVEHGHDFIEIVLVSSGKSLHRISGDSGNVSYGLIRGEVFTVMPGEIHSYCDSKNFEIYNIAFLPQVIAGEIDELSELNGVRSLFFRKNGEPHTHLYLDAPRRTLAAQYLQEMIYAVSRKNPAWKLQSKTAFLNFLFIIGSTEVLKCNPVKEPVRSLFLESLDYLEKNFQRKITLSFLARLAGMSVSGYTAQFRRTVGLSPMEYLINLRLNRVRNLLIHSDKELSEIAFECGFCDTNYMIKMFRIHEKITPAKLRRNQKL